MQQSRIGWLIKYVMLGYNSVGEMKYTQESEDTIVV